MEKRADTANYYSMLLVKLTEKMLKYLENAVGMGIV